ncbi:hypothetical protein NDU88_000394 [Pleurodeles waltl]|uniref:Uncharacterized protein n=1 Tax=Pleurodeles waltl TaxID=8319 RepID=A0AAV7KPT6_PLEWA|nr:hypothetical protein NDU88_000394 [Pleurodeles waltl]
MVSEVAGPVARPQDVQVAGEEKPVRPLLPLFIYCSTAPRVAAAVLHSALPIGRKPSPLSAHLSVRNTRQLGPT